MAQRDSITLDVAGEIDAQWTNSGMPANGLRIVGNRISGNRTITTLTVPGNDRAPGYVYTLGRFLHVYGPTLADWQAQQIALDNAARYEAQAADCAAQAETLPEPSKGWANGNAAVFLDYAAFYRSQAAQIASR